MSKKQEGGFLRGALLGLRAIRLGAKTVNTVSKVSQPQPQKRNANRTNNRNNRSIRVIDEKNNTKFTIRPTKQTLQFYTHGNSNTPVGEMHRNKIRNIAVNNNTLKITKTNNSSFTYKIANNRNRTNIKKNLTT